MMLSRVLSALVVPVGALLAAYLALPRLGEVPASLAGLKVYAPHIAIGFGVAASIGFGRSRTLLALMTLALACAVLHASPESALFHAITLAVPLNLAVLAWRRETGVLSPPALRYGAAMGVAAVLVVALCVMFPARVHALLQHHWLARLSLAPLGQPALAATAIGVATACTAWLYRREAAALALAAAMVAFALAAHAVRHVETASLYIATAALVLAIAVLQDIFRMAFRDSLTGLMSRRALEEHLAALGKRYVIAMVDVDHFKRVNDLYGHDAGDQVLRMVARMLGRVRRGARAYRYGGEEFALVFPGRDAGSVLETLEALREDIAGYPFRLRAGGRNTTGRRGRRKKPAAARALKVTVSIGMAQPDARASEPHAVLAMADKALYRAKHRGRNTVCH